MKKAHVYAIPAIGAALIAVLAQISLPIGPVPFTLQNFAIGLIATVFRPREAVLSVGLYLLLGAIGLPVLQEVEQDCRRWLVLLRVIFGFILYTLDLLPP